MNLNSFLSCPNECGAKNIEFLDDHLIVCLNGVFDCPNKVNGCQSMPMIKLNLFNHLKKHCKYNTCNQCGCEFSREDYFKHKFTHEYGILDDCPGCNQIWGNITDFQLDIEHFHDCYYKLLKSFDDDSYKTLYLIDNHIDIRVGLIKNVISVHLYYGFYKYIKPQTLPESVKWLFIYEKKQDLIIGSIPRSVTHLLLKHDQKIDSYPNIKKLFLKDGHNQILTSGKIYLGEIMWVFFTRIKTKNYQIVSPMLNH